MNRWILALVVGLAVAGALVLFGTASAHHNPDHNPPGQNEDCQQNANNPENCVDPPPVCDTGEAVGNPHCQPPVTATPDPEPTATPTPDPEPTATPTPDPTATPDPEPENTPTPDEPEVTSDPEEPVVVVPPVAQTEPSILVASICRAGDIVTWTYHDLILVSEVVEVGGCPVVEPVAAPSDETAPVPAKAGHGPSD